MMACKDKKSDLFYERKFTIKIINSSKPTWYNDIETCAIFVETE
jgi:hypothetical protein